MIKKVKNQGKVEDKRVQKDRGSNEADEIRAQLARALADYDNLIKRVEKERANQERILKSRVITKFLQVFDMLNEVQKNLNDAGLAIALNAIKDILKEENVEQINAEPGVRFNEEVHEAVEIVSEDDKENKEIVSLQQTGWRFTDGQVLRYAKVIVNKKEEN